MCFARSFDRQFELSFGPGESLADREERVFADGMTVEMRQDISSADADGEGRSIRMDSVHEFFDLGDVAI